MSTIYTAFCALRPDDAGTGGGVYIAEDFQITGPQPTWVAHNDGLPVPTDALSGIDLFRVDPHDPIRRQFVQIGSGALGEDHAIYRRDTAVGDTWTKVFSRSLAVAQGLLNWETYTGHAVYKALTALNWIAPDPLVPGRWYSLWSNFTYSAPGAVPETQLLGSDDYGDTWSVLGNLEAAYDIFHAQPPARGAGCVEGSADLLVAGVNYWLIPANSHHGEYSLNGGSRWFIESGAGVRSLGYSDSWPAIQIDPGDHIHAYGYGFQGLSNQDLYTLDGADADPEWVKLQDALDLASSGQNRTLLSGAINPDNLWIDPFDGTHQRIQAAGKLYTTHDRWATVDDATPADLYGSHPERACAFTAPADDSTPILFTAQPTMVGLQGVQACVSESDLTLHDRSGSGGSALPNRISAVYGLWVGLAPAVHGVKVYAVENENASGDVGDGRGEPQQGDRSAWRSDDYPAEHAQDLYHNTPHNHVPGPGAGGNVAVSDGSRWVSRELTGADVGLTALGLSALMPFKAPVRAATTAALPAFTQTGNELKASGVGALPAIDGVTLAVGERLLVKDEGSGTSVSNGIYSVFDVGDGSSEWILLRAGDAATSASLLAGTLVPVTEGATQADTFWDLTTDDPITLNTTALTFVQFSVGSGSITPSATVAAETSYGISSAAGTATTYARGDHTHGSPALASSTPAASAVGDSGVVGTGATPARADHKHAREAFGAVTAQTTYGASSANGSATTDAHSDHTHGTPAHELPSGGSGGQVLTKIDATSYNVDWETPSGGGGSGTPASSVTDETSYGISPAVGVGTDYARDDHTHGSPALTTNTPHASAVGDSGAVGTGTTPAKDDHKHAREAFASPSASAVGDASAAGTATTVPHSDHVHAREAFGAVTAETTYGASAANGSATTVAHSDHTHGNPAHDAIENLSVAGSSTTNDVSITKHGLAPTAPNDATKFLDGTGAYAVPAGTGPALATAAPSTSAVGDAAAVGSGTHAAKDDHVHGREAFGAVVSETSYGQAAANGTAATEARSDHTHGSPSLGSTGSTAAAGNHVTPVAVASGASHAAGHVPDPGVTGGTTKFLREDMTYAVPAGGGGSSGAFLATDTLWDTKGDLVAATGADAAAKIPVGGAGQVLMPDSAATTGLSWQTPDPAVAMAMALSLS